MTHIFHTVVLGGQAVVGSQAQSINIAEQQIIAGDFASLAKQLESSGLPASAIDALHQILPSEDAQVRDQKKLTLRLGKWVSQAAATIVKEGGKAALDAAKTALSTALLAYFGIPPGT